MSEPNLEPISDELRQEIGEKVVPLIEYLECIENCPDRSSARLYAEAVIWDLQVLLARLAVPDPDLNFPP